MSKTVENITVGDGPAYVSYLASNFIGDSVYVANVDNDTVSVIYRPSNTVKNITVGDGPRFVSISPNKHSVYIVHFFQ